ncbi:MAG: carboxylate--amine ligase [Phycisphaerae bacterium]
MTQPAVIILGIDTPIGLTLVRELGQNAVPVYGIGATRRAVGLYSRYLRRGYVHPDRNDDTIALLNRIARQHHADYLMTVSENDILFLNAHASEMPRLQRLFPTTDLLNRVLDKASACRDASQVGLNVPDCLTIDSPDQLTNLTDRLTYPVILKWARPADVLPQLQARNLPFLKAEYCHDVDGLRRALERYVDLGTFPMIQSFCPGVGLGQMVLMHHGQAVLKFQHRRLHEWPPEGGVSTLCQSVPLSQHADLFDKSIALLQRMKWEGLAMVEYRYDPQQDRAVFMEVNGRFWGSQPLAYHAGVHFAYATYQTQALGRLPQQPHYRPNLRCRYTIPDTKRLARILFQPQTIQNQTLRFNKLAEVATFLTTTLTPTTRHYVATWHDPKPALADLYHATKKATRILVNVAAGASPAVCPPQKTQSTHQPRLKPNAFTHPGTPCHK